jgi:hypothetical protein
MTHKLIKTENYLLVVSDDLTQATEGVYMYRGDVGVLYCQKGFWFDFKEPYKKIIAHLPLNGSPILEGVPLLPPIKDDAEELAKEIINYDGMNFIITNYTRSGFIIGYNKAKEKFLLEIDKQILDFTHDLNKTSSQHQPFEAALYGLNRLKYYLSQYQSEFECEMEPYTVGEMSEMPRGTVNQKPKTITTAQGIQWVGKYL